MFSVVSDGVAVYIYRQARAGSGRYEFLQLHRVQHDEIYGASWQPVYGGAELGELAPDCARREMWEETGLQPMQMFLVEHVETFYFRPRNWVMMLPVFAALVDDGESIHLNQEHDQFRWIEEDMVREKFIWRSQRMAISAILETLREYPQRIPDLVV